MRINLTEYHCECCKKTFYADYGVVERCPTCGSTSEVDSVRQVTFEEKERWDEKKRKKRSEK